MILGAALTGFIAASLYSDDQSSIVFRLAKPIIVDSWKALNKIATDPKFYNPVIKIVAWGLGIVVVWLIFQLGALKTCFNETACIFEFFPSCCKTNCLSIVGALSGNGEELSNQTQHGVYPTQNQAHRRSMHRRGLENRRRENEYARGNDYSQDTSSSYLPDANAPGVSTIDRSARQSRLYPTIQSQNYKIEIV